VLSVHYDIETCYHQQTHNSTICVLLSYLAPTCFGIVTIFRELTQKFL
jgi:hypothetical protein